MKLSYNKFCITSLATALFVLSASCQSGATTAKTFMSTSPSTITSTTVQASSAATTTQAPVVTSTTATVTSGIGTPLPLSTLPDGVVVFTKWRYARDRFTNIRIFDPLYKGKIFQISGTITGIIKDAGVPYIVVDDGSVPATLPYKSDWICSFQTDEYQLQALKQGQKITLQGVWGWGSRLIGNVESEPVYLDNCVVMVTV
jgi:hypothetical protein